MGNNTNEQPLVEDFQQDHGQQDQNNNQTVQDKIKGDIKLGAKEAYEDIKGIFKSNPDESGEKKGFFSKLKSGAGSLYKQLGDDSKKLYASVTGKDKQNQQ